MTAIVPSHRPLSRNGTRRFVYNLLQKAREQDLNENGLFDGRGGCINIWCSPTDQPACFAGIEITQGALNCPREIVGTLGWDWLDDDTVSFWVEACPYALADARKPGYRERLSLVTEEENESCLDWLEAKARALLASVEVPV